MRSRGQVRDERPYIVAAGIFVAWCSIFGYGSLDLEAASRLKKKRRRCRYCGGSRASGNNFEGWLRMSKRELIDRICEINRGAKPEFLAHFAEKDLKTYLEHLMEVDVEEMVVTA